MPPENGSGPLTFRAFVAYMDEYRREQRETYVTKDACEGNHHLMSVEAFTKLQRDVTVSRVWAGVVAAVVASALTGAVVKLIG